MNNPHIVLHMAQPAPALALLNARLPGLSVSTCDSYAALPDHIAEHKPQITYSVRFAGTPDFPSSALAQSDSIRWISVGGSGTDHLLRWDPAKVTVTNAAGVAAEMMAEYTLGALLHFSLGLPAFRRDQAARRWTTANVRPLQGQTLLILGLGHTGQAVARYAKALGLYVIGLRAHPKATAHVDEVLSSAAIDSVLARADALVVCLPLLDNTRGLLSKDRINSMKPGAVLVDISRGGVVDQAALAKALAEGHLGGAALDVFEVEPLPEDSPFWAMDNVIISPHCASVYEGWELKSVAMFADNLRRYLAGEVLHNIVDPDLGY